MRAASREFPEKGEFGVKDRTREGKWHDAVKGVLALATQCGARLRGLDLYVAGNYNQDNPGNSAIVWRYGLDGTLKWAKGPAGGVYWTNGMAIDNSGGKWLATPST